MSKIRTSTTLAAGFIGGVAFLVACGGGSGGSGSAVNDAIADTLESLWESIGADIYYTGGNVGIGTNSPDEPLHIGGGSPSIKLQASSSGDSAISFVGFHDGSGERLGYIGDAASGNKDIYLWSEGDNNVVIGNSINSTDNGAQIHIAPHGGEVGIGTTSPVSRLAVSGLPTSAPDSSGNAGVVCVTNDGNFWLDNDGTADCS